MNGLIVLHVELDYLYEYCNNWVENDNHLGWEDLFWIEFQMEMIKMNELEWEFKGIGQWIQKMGAGSNKPAGYEKMWVNDLKRKRQSFGFCRWTAVKLADRNG